MVISALGASGYYLYTQGECANRQLNLGANILLTTLEKMTRATNTFGLIS